MSVPIKQVTLGAYRITVIKSDEPHQLRPYLVCLRDCLHDTTPVQSNFSSEGAAVHLAAQLERAVQDGASFGPGDDFSDLL